jgi:hypothetical protein
MFSRIRQVTKLTLSGTGCQVPIEKNGGCNNMSVSFFAYNDEGFCSLSQSANVEGKICSEARPTTADASFINQRFQVGVSESSSQSTLCYPVITLLVLFKESMTPSILFASLRNWPLRLRERRIGIFDPFPSKLYALKIIRVLSHDTWVLLCHTPSRPRHWNFYAESLTQEPMMLCGTLVRKQFQRPFRTQERNRIATSPLNINPQKIKVVKVLDMGRVLVSAGDCIAVN